MRKIYKKIIAWTLVVLWMCVIFMFSAEKSDESNETSESTLVGIGTMVSEEFKNLPEEEQVEKVEPYQTIIRKIAHVVEFAVLGILSYIAFLQHKKKKTVLWATALCFLYAITDEIHQLFVEGRACRWYDVLIDTGGALIGIGIVILVIKLYKRKKQTV